MDKESLVKKFGDEYYANEDTYHMGIHYQLAEPIAQRFKGYKLCLDACVGAGFTTLFLAKYVDNILAVDVNHTHLEQARYNSQIAYTEKKIEFVEGNVLEVIDSIDFDSAFLDPDWAKAGDNKENHVFELSDMVPNTELLLKKVFTKTKNICLRLPKEFDLQKLNDFPTHESEAVYQDARLKFYCVYFGDLIKTEGTSELRV